MTAPRHHHDRFVRRVGSAIDRGAVIDGEFGAHWDVSGRCFAPVYRELKTSKILRTRKKKRLSVYDTASEVTEVRTLEMSVRCRKCENCLKARAAKWRISAKAEISAAARTWFGTLTLDPVEQFKALSLARLRLAKSGEDYDALTEAEKFSARDREIKPELTKWLKRLRKNSGAEVRYILVAEAHHSGAPHYHVLIHEVTADHPVRHSVLKATWKHGFSKFNLVVDDRAAGYVCKYLSKSLLSRVRASQGYGHPQPNPALPMVPYKM